MVLQRSVKNTTLEEIRAHVFVAISTHDDVASGIPEVWLVDGFASFDIRMQPNDVLTLLEEVNKNIKDLHRIDDVLALKSNLGALDLFARPDAISIHIQFFPSPCELHTWGGTGHRIVLRETKRTTRITGISSTCVQKIQASSLTHENAVLPLYIPLYDHVKDNPEQKALHEEIEDQEYVSHHNVKSKSLTLLFVLSRRDKHEVLVDVVAG